MASSVIIIGAILAAIVIIVNLVVSKATSKEKFTGYFPSVIVALAGFAFLFMAPIVEKVDMMGAGYGGWGIACLFAAALGFIITSLVESYANVKA
ncbi:hypothetical protein [Virgibacillus halodenitrificans]|jgi:hypothetical protein|uniref:Uncharacterized protein n=1 Tax=Virgibacillus halodenitrificans TaxID=1482 RepID=A0AAC9J474_VIRHA|nr:hypothetical protein [Virgibacillus halodenitrificans]APC49214.1 hypothetical protein BME96_13860 [Virgibacillus halodenitrificans]MBD1222234.1 hypothetical protein [Virgibacillus halodenitrificans]MCG1026764.1 hypothetical protein [Virgibacillus halodenitrificans]MCJ0930167.1 hypothetical protein [Virgibacillus halodenitrificans]MEC2160614.1 hypothetical protein [Virgibacillus halodenitrificans]